MWSNFSKASTAILVALVVAGIVTITVLEHVDTEPVIAGLFGLANLLLGAGAVSHGVNQGASATSDATAASVRK